MQVYLKNMLFNMMQLKISGVFPQMFVCVCVCVSTAARISTDSCDVLAV